MQNIGNRIVSLLTDKVNNNLEEYTSLVSEFLHPLCQEMDTALFASVALLWTHCSDSQRMFIKGLKPTHVEDPLGVIDRREKIYRALYTLSIDVHTWIDDVFTNHGPIETQGDLVTAIYWTLCHKRLPIVEKKTIKRKAVEDEVAGIMLELACPPRKKMFSDPIERILMGVDHIFGSMDHTMTIYNRSCMEDFCRVFQFLLSESRVYTNDGYPVSLLHAYQHYIQNCK